MDYSLNLQEKLVLIIKANTFFPFFILVYLSAVLGNSYSSILAFPLIFSGYFIWIIWPFLVWKSLQNIMHPQDNKYSNGVGYVLFFSALVLTLNIDGLDYLSQENSLNNRYSLIKFIISNISGITFIICCYIVWGKAAETLTYAEKKLKFIPKNGYLTFFAFFVWYIGIFFLPQRIENVFYQLKRNQKIEEEQAKKSTHPQ